MKRQVCAHKHIFCCPICLQSELRNEHQSFLLMCSHIHTHLKLHCKHLFCYFRDYILPFANRLQNKSFLQSTNYFSGTTHHIRKTLEMSGLWHLNMNQN